MSGVPRLEAELRDRPPLGVAAPGKLDTRTKEGKRYKGQLLAEVILWREKGYDLYAISDAIGVQASTLMRWLVAAGRSDLWQFANRSRAAHDRGFVKADRAFLRAQQTRERQERILEVRAECRRLIWAGKPLPWHVLREEPQLTLDQRAEIQRLAEQQDRDTDALGRRPWLVSLDAPLTDNEGEPIPITMLDTLVAIEERASSIYERMMMANGMDALRARRLKPRPWRVSRPVREMYPEAA